MTNPTTSFDQLGLPAPIMAAIADLGYETPSPIQAQTIPLLLEGHDMIGQAQTGTGKTAAFALPALARLEAGQKTPQVLVLAPTRELAIQVAEAFQAYARQLPDFHVLPLYGGSDYRGQFRQLQRGVQVVVGTPGRVMDHIRRGSLDLSGLKQLVLDEADEMLRMGFIEDVEWIMGHTPEGRQIALFSATMPAAIKRIADTYLTDPQHVAIEVQAVTNSSIRQRVWMMVGVHKLDALTRILETEDFDAAIIFVRTRISTSELADKLAARGYASAALNGDIPQKQREQTIDRLKQGKLDVLVATDVAARGLDVERISHVINYDIPNDVEAYVHRIGRTGRAGRSGEAILFAANRERRLLKAIERSTGQQIERMELPTAEEVTDKRIAKFKGRITETLDSQDLDLLRKLVADYQQEYGVPVLDIAAALGVMAQGKKQLQAKPGKKERQMEEQGERPERPSRRERGEREEFKERKRKARSDDKSPPEPDKGLERFRIEVGHKHGVKPGNIVGAIANEAEIDAEYIGRIELYEDYSTVDLPEGMPKEVFKHLKSVWVSGQKLQISRPATSAKRPAKQKSKHKAKGGKKPGGKPRS